MSFMEEYKKPDSLCQDMYHTQKGVTTYIEKMENTYGATYVIPGWKKDYETLKGYRHLKNRIAHEPDVYEEDECDEYDEEWIYDFHQRIMNQEDPLGLYRKYQQEKTVRTKKASETTPSPQDFKYTIPEKPDRKTTVSYKKKSSPNVLSILFILLLIMCIVGCIGFLSGRIF